MEGVIPALPDACVRNLGASVQSKRVSLIIDVTMTLLVIGLTTIFVRLLAWSLT